VLGVAAVQVTHPLAARLPPEVQEAVADGVVLKHDVVHVSVPLRSAGGDKVVNGNEKEIAVITDSQLPA